MTDPAPQPSLEVNNLNYAGVPLFFGFVVAPLMVLFVIGAFLTGGLKDKAGAVDWPPTYIMGVTFLVVAGILVYQGLTSPVLWIEFGERLRYRKPLGLRTREWGDVRSLSFEDEQGQVNTRLPGVAIPLGTHRIVVLMLDDGTVLRAKVTPDQEVRIQRIVASANRHEAEDSMGGSENPGGPTVHYLFAHKALPNIAFQDPAGFLSVVIRPEGQQVLRNVWEDIRTRYGSGTDPAPAAFPVTTFLLGEECAVTIELPQPRGPAEAYFVAFATRLPEPADEPPPPTPPRARYFTLE